MMRPIMSIVLPAANGATIRTGLVGNCWAWAPDCMASAITAITLLRSVPFIASVPGHHCRQYALTFFFDVFCEAGIFMIGKTRRQPEFEQGDGNSGAEIINVRTYFGKLQRFDRFVHQLLERGVRFFVKQF